MFNKILVPVDGSDLAEKAIDRAIILADYFEAELHFLRVYGLEQVLADPHSAFDTFHLVVTAEEAKKRALAYLEKTQKRLHDLDLVIKTDAIESVEKVGKTIADYASTNGFELIVMTSHGYTGFRRLVMGSVTTETLQHAKCPVMVIKSAEKD